jgi:hypothetical protein
MKYPVEINTKLKDADGNMYLVLNERPSINQSSHSVGVKMDYLCRDLGRAKDRWIQYSTMLGMFQEGKLKYN